MKKLAIVCAIVLAAGLSSCGDTNYCYEVTQTYKIGTLETSTTNLWWGTKNDLKSYEQTLKEELKKSGISEDIITITSKRANKSQSDCH